MRPLTVKQVAAISTPGTRWVSRNLYVQVSDAGTKSWLFRYMLNGHARGMGLGSLELVTLAEARDKALLCRKLLLEGIDPLEERRSKRMQALLTAASTMTFQQCAERYIAAHSKGWKNSKHRAQWTSTLKTYAYPVIGDLSVAAVDTALVMQIVEPLWATKTETAARLRGRLEAILDWAKARNYRAGENPARWRGHLDQLLPARAQVAPVNHHQALPYAEMPAFMTALRQQAGTAARCLELMGLTAVRSSEAREAQWSEIDHTAKIWTILGERMKSRKSSPRPHTVPLSDAAAALLERLPRRGELVFEGDRRGRPISETSIRKLLKRMGRADATQHGFRSTFRDWAAEQTDHPNHVVEMALAHTISDKVEAAYRRGDLLGKRRQLMTDWASYCASSVQ